MLKNIKYTNKIIEKGLVEAVPSKYIFNPEQKPQKIDLDIPSKKIVVTSHFLERFKERFFYDAEWKEVVDFILINSKKLVIIKLHETSKIVEKQYKAEVLIGDVASLLFFIDTDDKYVFKTVYPIQTHDRFYDAMEQMSKDKKLVDAIRDADANFMKELNDNFFKTTKERDDFYNLQVVTNIIRKKRKAVKYKGTPLAQVWVDSKKEFESFIDEIEINIPKEKKQRQDIVFEPEENDSEFNDILEGYKETF